MDCTAFATSSCGPTLVLGVHEIATYAQFSMLKKPNFNPIPGFYGPTSQSSPILKTVLQIYNPLPLIKLTYKVLGSVSQIKYCWRKGPYIFILVFTFFYFIVFVRKWKNDSIWVYTITHLTKISYVINKV